MHIVLIFIILVKFATSSLPHCSEDVDKVQICRTKFGYDKSFPSKPWPMLIENTVRVVDVVELNTNENTLTILVQLMVLWDDPGLTLKSNKPNE